ncbi:uncharacterized protein LOC131859002 [Cryptomeria japonica]|uniref:uncharacterized protein LOC131859002 n=1 Tax=Cryptomeria japonica TaxID=3369 RepID=UPI0027DA8762|nr:uncharacterized protein LOC131859002 [Cryptomeria japonica]
MKTRSEEAKIKKEKPAKAKKEKPSKIQFKRKGKIVEPPAPKASVTTWKRKKKQAKKSVAADEEETESEGEKKALRASGKRLKDVGTSTVKKPVDDVQMSKQQQGREEKKDGEDKSSEEPPVHTQIVLPPVSDNEKNKEEEKIEEKTEDKPEEEKEEEEKEIEKSEPKVTPLSFTSKKKIDDDEDDDALSIQGPINMDMLSSTELMEISTAMQSREKKKRMKEQQKEVEIIKHAVEILSSLLPETDTNNFATPIDKLGQLVNDVGEHMKTFEDATYVNERY